MKCNILYLLSFVLIANSSSDIDPNGYILYCPCMGRFGNQADHFLGVLAFAKGLNRTLVLPPWVEYRHGQSKSVQVPFDTYFKVEPLQKYHRVLTMEIFMKDLAPVIWPESERTVLCYRARKDSDGCNAKDGNPFGPFWDTFGIDFNGSSFYQPLTYNINYDVERNGWLERYPSEKWLVLAFTGAPAPFPVAKANVGLQQYLEWSDLIEEKRRKILEKFPRGPFVGIHLRNGIDWERACVHVDQSPNLFAAPQCLGYRNEHGRATKELCLPSFPTIIKQLKRAVRSVSATTIYVASDNDYMMDKLSAALRKMNVKVLSSNGGSPHEDLAVLGLSNHFIGNCISSFSAFVKRGRDTLGLSSSFWAFPLSSKSGERREHIEL